MTDQTTPPFNAKRILVPVDMRHAAVSQKAIETAVYFARPGGSEVLILTVANPLGTHITDMPEAHKPAFEAFVKREAEALDYPIKPLLLIALCKMRQGAEHRVGKPAYIQNVRSVCRLGVGIRHQIDTHQFGTRITLLEGSPFTHHCSGTLSCPTVTTIRIKPGFVIGHQLQTLNGEASQVFP